MRGLLLISMVFGGCQLATREPLSGDHQAHATTFTIHTSGSETKVINTQPWPKANEVRAFTVQKPLKRVVCTSTSHLPYFELLGEVDAVVGFPGTQYISSDLFVEKVAKGEIKDLGSSQSLNMELLISLDPDAVIAFDAGGASGSLDQIQQMDIPVIYNSDFLEQTPLGRAEYIKFFGALLGKERKADSIFRAIERRYQMRAQMALNETKRPTILSGTTYGDAWFLPGGKNWSAVFFRDAGGRYLWGDDPSSGWLELSGEAVYEKAHDADYWIGVSTFETRQELLGQDDRYGDFGAFQGDQVFNYHKKKGPSGGYDFFESGYARPDLVLSDLIKILHPHLLPDYETVYFQRIP